MKISHSNLVLQFFESQSSDPKPAKFIKNNILNSSNNNNNFSQNSRTNSSNNSIEDDMMIEYDNDLDYEAEENENVNNTSSQNNEICDDINLAFDNYDNDSYENEEEAEDDDDVDDEDTDDLSSNLSGFNLKKINFHNSISKKRVNHKEAGHLWWDEDEALNELTSSISFDFSTIKKNNHPLSINHQQNNKTVNPKQQHLIQQDQSFELETLKSLESLFKNSDLFNNQNESSNQKENNNNSNKHIANLKSSSNNIVRRLSLS